MLAFCSVILSLIAPWPIIGLLAFVVGIIMFENQLNMSIIYEQNTLILDLLEKKVSKKHGATLSGKQKSKKSVDYERKGPVFTEEGLENEDSVRATSSQRTAKMASSGYNMDQKTDVEWELYKISRAPIGPVPMKQQYLTITCQTTGLYVKAVVDELHTVIHIVTYQKDEEEKWSWTPTVCCACIQKVRRVLADGQCRVPYAIDLAADQEEEIQVDKIEDAGFLEGSDGCDADVSESGDLDDSEKVIEKPIPSLPPLDDFEFIKERYSCDHHNTLLFDV